MIALVDRLRDPVFGCPWDLEQTHSSLIPYVLEEAHEVADAIRHGDDQDLEEELGDLLLQVVLHARIAQEEGRFDLAGVAGRIAAKLVRRHPHVFAPDQRPGARPDAAAGEKPTGDWAVTARPCGAAGRRSRPRRRQPKRAPGAKVRRASRHPPGEQSPE